MTEAMQCGHPAEFVVKSVESDYQFCELCEAKSQLRDALTMEREHREAVEWERRHKPVAARLFVIRQRNRRLYWCCSTEHATGWTPNFPKQAFTKSELSQQIHMLIERGWFTDCEIIELQLPKWTEEAPA